MLGMLFTMIIDVAPDPADIIPTLQKPESFRAPDDGISTSFRQGVKGEAVIIYCEPLATRVADPVEDGNLEFFGFPALVRA